MAGGLLGQGVGGVSDAARHASEAVNMAVVAGDTWKWLAIKLHDGRSDGKAYDCKADAMRFQFHEQMCMYLKVPPDGMPPEVAQRMLDIHRKVYDAGFRFEDPAHVLGLPMAQEDIPWS